MKKLFPTILVLNLLAIGLNAQNSSDKFRFGLRVSAQPSWLRSNDIKKIEPSGAVFGSGFGLVMDWKINDVASFSTGIGGDFEGGKQKFVDTTFYVVNKDDEIIEFPSDTSSYYANSAYMLTERKLKTTAINIPLVLKLSTNEIKNFKYFGQFGLDLGILLKLRSTDQVKTIMDNGVPISYKEEELTDVNPYQGTIPVRLGLNVGAGAEYRLTGSTSAFATINYVHQFINTFVADTKYYAESYSTSGNKLIFSDRAKQSAFGSAIQINLGILF